MTHKKLICNLAILMTAITTILSNKGIIKAQAEVPNNTTSSYTSCINPKYYAEKGKCQSIEQQILSSTVRIEMQGFILMGGKRLPMSRCGKSHGTVIDNRYLLTHNHFAYSLTEEAPVDGEGYIGLKLRSTDGELLLDTVPLSALTIVHQDAEILVLDLLDGEGHSLIEDLQLPSPWIIDWQAVDWTIGLELAHIDWDGETAHVDWVVVEKMDLDGEFPHIQVSNFAKDGASGGGLYWNGIHVGNNWAINWDRDSQTNEVLRKYTLIALNTLESVLAAQN